jgi:hypothetical protein
MEGDSTGEGIGVEGNEGFMGIEWVGFVCCDRKLGD